MNRLIRLALILTVAVSCSTNDESESTLNDSRLAIINVQNETQADYLIVDSETGDHLVIDIEENNRTAVHYRDNIQRGYYSLFLDELGYPEKLVADDYIFLFTNFNGLEVDLTILSPDGEVTNLRKVEGDYNWDNFDTLAISRSQSSFRDVISTISTAWHATVCIVSIAGAVSSGGLGIPAVIASCSGLIFDILIDYLPNLAEALGISSVAVSTFLAIDGCVSGQPVECVVDIVDLAMTLIIEANNFVETNSTVLDGFPVGISTFFTSEILDEFESAGMDIHSGLLPSLIEGNYFGNSQQNLETGQSVVDISYQFADQKPNKQLLVSFVSAANESSIEDLGYISGQNSKFSVFVEQFGEVEDQTDGHTINIHLGSIYSGEISSNGIMNFQFGFILLDKENDYNNQLIEIGTKRILIESDGLLEEVDQFPFFDSPLPSPFENKNHSLGIFRTN